MAGEKPSDQKPKTQLSAQVASIAPSASSNGMLTVLLTLRVRKFVARSVHEKTATKRTRR